MQSLQAKWMQPKDVGAPTLDSIQLKEVISPYAIEIICELVMRDADALFDMSVELSNEIMNEDDLRGYVVTQYNNAKKFIHLITEQNRQMTHDLAEAKKVEIIVGQSNIVKHDYEFPGVDLLTLEDGYVIGIDSNSVHLYNSINDFNDCRSIESFEFVSNNEPIVASQETHKNDSLITKHEIDQTETGSDILHLANGMVLVLDTEGAQLYDCEDDYHNHIGPRCDCGSITFAPHTSFRR